MATLGVVVYPIAAATLAGYAGYGHRPVDEMDIGVQIDTAISRIETTRQRLETARRSSELARETLSEEQKRLQEGVTNSFQTTV